MTAYRPIEPWQSKDGDIWTRRYMAAKGGGGYVRQATVHTGEGANAHCYLWSYRRVAKKKKPVLFCTCKGGRDLADIVAVQPVRLARRPWLIGQKLKGVKSCLIG